MKTKSLLSIAAVTMMALASCENVATPETPAGKQETYTVKLACAGELAVNHVPLKSSSDDLYGIRVQYRPVSGGSLQNYAYGLFDDVSDVSIELLADYEYLFSVDMIVDGKNKVYSFNMNELEDEEIVIGYGNPFNSGYKTLTPITNEFILSNDKTFSNLGGDIQLTNGVVSELPKGVDVYYGKLNKYVPEEDGATISIHMKHMIFGLKVVADDFLTQGSVAGKLSTGSSVYDNNSDSFTLSPSAGKTYEATYACTKRGEWYDKEVQKDAYVDMYMTGLTWIKDENTTLKLDTQRIRMIRMMQTVVNVTFFEDESAGNTKVSMVFDDLEMSENETTYTFGDDQEEYYW